MLTTWRSSGSEGLGLALLLGACGPPPAVAPGDVAAAETELAEATRAWLAEEDWARDDGWVYAVDVAQLMLWSALSGDGEVYGKLHGFAVANLVLDRHDDPYTSGFVVWRWQRDAEPEASGTTEMLRLAEALWRGAEAFGSAEDRELAALILRGYARHTYVDNGVWLVRNYFNLATRAFATNSYLVDYAPDFVAEVAAALRDEELAEVAERSYELLADARAPTGLVYAIVQPEVATLMDERLVIFSPNDVVQLSNSATAAERAVEGWPNVARGVLAFAKQKAPRLCVSYYGRTGEVAISRPCGVETWAGLVRLAALLGDREALDLFLPYLVEAATDAADDAPEPRLYVAGELLLGLRAALQ